MEFYESIYSSKIEMEGLMADKQNMHQDVQKLRSDFKKAVKKYQLEKAIDG